MQQLTKEEKEKINIKIAESLGLTPIKIFPKGKYPVEFAHCLPNYPEDFNEMHKAKTSLTEEELGTMLDHLCNIVRRDHKKAHGPMTAIIQSFRASALQEAEAYLLTKNLL